MTYSRWICWEGMLHKGAGECSLWKWLSWWLWANKPDRWARDWGVHVPLWGRSLQRRQGSSSWRSEWGEEYKILINVNWQAPYSISQFQDSGSVTTSKPDDDDQNNDGDDEETSQAALEDNAEEEEEEPTNPDELKSCCQQKIKDLKTKLEELTKTMEETLKGMNEVAQEIAEIEDYMQNGPTQRRLYPW